MNPITENTFAEACYNDNSIYELEQALIDGADEIDMKAWKLTETEWTEQIQLALNVLKSEK